MSERLGSYLASKPKRTAAIVLTLLVVLVLVSAGLALELLHVGRAPYPSQKLPLRLVHGQVIYTQDNTYGFQNMTSNGTIPYTGMKIIFRVAQEGGSMQMSAVDFGNQSRLSTNITATVHQVLLKSSWGNVSINITDSTGDGSFDTGDTIVFEAVPLVKDMVYTMGLLWNHGGAAAMEVSFSVHDGKLYAWNSQYIEGTSWYEPYLHD